MKKICFITTVSITLKSFILKTAEYIHEHTDWEISFICDEDEAFAKFLPEYIRYFPVKMKRGISLGAFKAIRQMQAIFKKEKFDMIQYSTPNASLYASIAGKKAGIPIRNYHLMGLRYLGASGIRRKLLKGLEKRTCKNSTSIECVSVSNLELSIREGLFSAEKASVVWNGSTGGVDLEKFSFMHREQWRKEVRQELNIDEDEYVFGFVGRITKDKGIDEILQAYAGIDAKAKLLFVGDVENIATLNATLYQDAQANERIIFHKAVPDVQRYFSAIDVLLLPSYREGFGNVVIEAAAMGTPAIISDIPGPIDAVQENKTAFIVPVRDYNALRQAMERCITEKPFNPEDCVRFVQEKFDAQQLCGYILQRKQELLGEERTIVEKVD